MQTPSPSRGLDLLHKGSPVRKEILNTLREDIRATSLRAVARSTGLSPTGLSRLINSGRAYKPSRDRLDIWFMKRQPTSGSQHNERLDTAVSVILEAGGEIMWKGDAMARRLGTVV